MSEIKISLLQEHSRPPEGAIDVLIAIDDVPFLPLIRTFSDDSGNHGKIVAIDPNHRMAPAALEWYQQQPSDCVFYIEQKIESLPALAHYLSYFPYGDAIMKRLRNAYLAKVPKEERKPTSATPTTSHVAG